MPGEAEMVFRSVAVPGGGFWADQDRTIQIGDATGGIFEGLQRTQISGSFPADNGEGWLIYLAKYELTQGQFIAVMGMDALMSASGDPDIESLPGLQGRALREALMQPLSFVAYHDVVAFIHRYNQWLFDPEHPERITALPRLDDAPGFLRLPTEQEWEYVVRGGLPALRAGSFNDPLPFSPRQLNEHAWHLGNARHQIRPVGLRAADGLGFHDLLGNVQEMTAGLFRPEIWQGKPGGVAVRGGSVSTPATELRSALRAELDVYAWDADRAQVLERRSFNTGARLAIGANVVVSSAQRSRIEQEYEAYRTELRRSMPVGRTLDNRVAQAAGQISDADPIIERLIEQNPQLHESLAAIQALTINAREQLELAQREAARSLAQDAARNGVNLSVYLSRLTRLATTLDSARRLAEISTRYQEQVEAVERSIAELDEAVSMQLQAYGEKVASLGDYQPEHLDMAIDFLTEQEPPRREAMVLELLRVHAETFAEQRRPDRDTWLEDFRSSFTDFIDG
ncbi:MAG: hypothetical protein EA418_01940 [Wenzhouxiangellaceae bacterium]|nr:MAG: hypothetical protein EA418_01940 [Wenzhouxiangellaceae bacterium]